MGFKAKSKKKTPHTKAQGEKLLLLKITAPENKWRLENRLKKTRFFFGGKKKNFFFFFFFFFFGKRKENPFFPPQNEFLV